MHIPNLKKKKSLKEFINEELQNSNTVVQQNTEQANENVQESENTELKET